jgi:hypothetical protein
VKGRRNRKSGREEEKEKSGRDEEVENCEGK